MSEEFVKRNLAKYLLIGQDIKRLQEEQRLIKSDIDPYLDQADTNARGSYVIGFTDSLQIGETRYKAVQRVRKESKILNEERTLAFLKQDQAFEHAIITVEHVDQDALWNLFVQDIITQEELDSFFDVTESFAFLPTKE